MSKADGIKIVKQKKPLKLKDGSELQLYDIVDVDGWFLESHLDKEEAEQELLRIQAEIREEEEEEAMEAARHYISPTAKIIRFPFIALGYVLATVYIFIMAGQVHQEVKDFIKD